MHDKEMKHLQDKYESAANEPTSETFWETVPFEAFYLWFVENLPVIAAVTLCVCLALFAKSITDNAKHGGKAY